MTRSSSRSNRNTETPISAQNAAGSTRPARLPRALGGPINVRVVQLRTRRAQAVAPREQIQRHVDAARDAEPTVQVASAPLVEEIPTPSAEVVLAPPVEVVLAPSVEAVLVSPPTAVEARPPATPERRTPSPVEIREIGQVIASRVAMPGAPLTPSMFAPEQAVLHILTGLTRPIVRQFASVCTKARDVVFADPHTSVGEWFCTRLPASIDALGPTIARSPFKFTLTATCPAPTDSRGQPIPRSSSRFAVTETTESSSISVIIDLQGPRATGITAATPPTRSRVQAIEWFVKMVWDVAECCMALKMPFKIIARHTISQGTSVSVNGIEFDFENLFQKNIPGEFAMLPANEAEALIVAHGISVHALFRDLLAEGSVRHVFHFCREVLKREYTPWRPFELPSSIKPVYSAPAFIPRSPEMFGPDGQKTIVISSPVTVHKSRSVVSVVGENGKEVGFPLLYTTNATHSAELSLYYNSIRTFFGN